MAWDVARSLDVLLAQINALAPGRDRSSDGSIGDTAHQGTTSDHNPEDKPGNEPDEVDARDFTHDPHHGADMGVISERLRLTRDRRIRYVIFNRRIFAGYPVPARAAWTWGQYSGDNPHTHHMHVSVNDVDDDDTTPWRIGAPDQEDDMRPEGHDIHPELTNAQIMRDLWDWAVSNQGGVKIDQSRFRFRTIPAQVAGMLAAQPAGTVALTDVDRMAIVTAIRAELGAEVESAVRRVLGGLDGAIPGDA